MPSMTHSILAQSLVEKGKSYLTLVKNDIRRYVD